jgi:hypothetical protein
MKKYLLIALLSVINVVMFSSCDKKDNPDPIVNNDPSFSNTPEATAVNDDKSGGVYKGVLTGSSGTVKIILQNGTASAIVIFDGVTKTLTTTSLTDWTSGQAISNAKFTSGDWELIFSVNADGSNPQISVTIPEHTIQVAIFKESSVEITRTFEGTYTREDISFPLNCVITGNKVKFPGLTSVGTLTGNDISLDAPEKEFTLTGKINQDKITGTGNSVEHVDDMTNDLPGTWVANRTL